MSEAMKTWTRVPSDKEWHELFHKKESDPRCKFCQQTQKQAQHA